MTRLCRHRQLVRVRFRRVWLVCHRRLSARYSITSTARSKRSRGIV